MYLMGIHVDLEREREEVEQQHMGLKSTKSRQHVLLSKDDDLLLAGTEDYIHIRIQQRNSKKILTTVNRIADDYDKKKLRRVFKKKFACNGTVIEHPEYREVSQLQGGQCKNICQFLVETGLAKDKQLKVHGF
ncbi:eukaryotic translation initiation factor 1-like [Orycteropus afer afer]|uniref:Eukaryotic translation initiation factor 1-like n=1 Tax=Orycteropus afer afer TaxID=1230840 RepID=A0AC54Z567_ORYAF|nr:eukaryotic translation initiation factor 1-like [Orycteropus afer afer]